LLSSRGWLVVSTQEGIAPDDIFITLKKLGETTKYVKASRVMRNDVNVHFNQLTMSDVGYEVIADITHMDGKYMLGLARGYKNKLVECSQFNIPLEIKGVE
jgi:hypothetical protein